MNILIVDDNANNRMILKLLLEDYNEKNNTAIKTIDECVNGREAVQSAQEKKYDLIFMDIIMPEMDGIEATEIIRQQDKEVMIIAVSAVDDAMKQKEILRCGAEDYVPKPLESEQLFARLDNYLSLLKQRHHGDLSIHRKASNLYTKTIFKRQTIFYVVGEGALSEFWEYYLLGDEPIKVDGLSDVVRAVFAIGEAIVKVDGEPWIIVEADDEAIYFTLNKIDVIGELLVKLIMKKNKEVSEFKIDDTKISFKLNKVISYQEESTPVIVEKKIEPTITQDVQTEITQTNTDDYKVFDYMDGEDLLDMQEHLGDLSSLMLMIGSSDIEASEIQQIASLLDTLGRRLCIYTESYTIGIALSDLSKSILTDIDRFLEIANDLSALSGAFVSDLQTWVKLTFHEGAPSVDFMNDTIVANVQTISSLLSSDESTVDEGEMDDIFDF